MKGTANATATLSPTQRQTLERCRAIEFEAVALLGQIRARQWIYHPPQRRSLWPTRPGGIAKLERAWDEMKRRMEDAKRGTCSHLGHDRGGKGIREHAVCTRCGLFLPGWEGRHAPPKEVTRSGWRGEP